MRANQIAVQCKGLVIGARGVERHTLAILKSAEFEQPRRFIRMA